MNTLFKRHLFNVSVTKYNSTDSFEFLFHFSRFSQDDLININVCIKAFYAMCLMLKILFPNVKNNPLNESIHIMLFNLSQPSLAMEYFIDFLKYIIVTFTELKSLKKLCSDLFPGIYSQ